jgi:hypothetical protein
MTQNTMETVKTTLMPPLLPGGLMPGLVSVVPVDCGAEDVKTAPPDRMICQSQTNIIAAQAAGEIKVKAISMKTARRPLPLAMVLSKKGIANSNPFETCTGPPSRLARCQR